MGHHKSRISRPAKARAKVLKHRADEGMSHLFVWLSAALLIALALFASASGAKAAQFPDCHAVPVEAKIVRDFNWAERKTWNRGYTLARLSGAHEHRTKRFDGSEVTRRYCMAKAHFTNGDRRTIYFMVSDIGGFVGKNWDVTHCVMGLEPWRNHGGNCRTMR